MGNLHKLLNQKHSQIWEMMHCQYGISVLVSRSHFPGKPLVVFRKVGCLLGLSYPPPLWTYFLCPLYLLFLVPPLFFPSLFFSSVISFLFFLFLFHPPLHSSFYPFPLLLSTDISSPPFFSPSLFLPCPFLLPLPSPPLPYLSRAAFSIWCTFVLMVCNRLQVYDVPPRCSLLSN